MTDAEWDAFLAKAHRPVEEALAKHRLSNHPEVVRATEAYSDWLVYRDMRQDLKNAGWLPPGTEAR